MEFTITTREGAPRAKDGKSSTVRRAGARWFTCMCCSQPSSDSFCGSGNRTPNEYTNSHRNKAAKCTVYKNWYVPVMQNMPALLINKLSGSFRASQVAASFRTEANDRQSSSITCSAKWEQRVGSRSGNLGAITWKILLLSISLSSVCIVCYGIHSSGGIFIQGNTLVKFFSCEIFPNAGRETFHLCMRKTYVKINAFVTNEVEKKYILYNLQ